MANNKRYTIFHRITKQKALVIAANAQDAYFKVGWTIGDCAILHTEPLPSNWQQPPTHNLKVI